MGEPRTQPASTWIRRARAGAVLAVLLPPVGFVVSLVAMRRIERDDPRGHRAAKFGVACGTVLSLSLLVWAGTRFVTLTSNPAQKEVRPFIASVRDDGGSKLCDNGDSGHGPDNRRPWYAAYYEIADRPGLTDAIEADAARAGYPLEPDTAEIAARKQSPGGPSQPTFDPKADYLVSVRHGNRLEVTIDRDTAVPLYCGVANYGARRPTGKGSAIVTISMRFPDPLAATP